MIINRINDSLPKQVKDLNDEALSIKSNQRMWRGVLPVYETTTVGNPDFTWNTPINYFDRINYWYKFVADNNQYPLVKIVLDLRDKTSNNHTNPDKVYISLQDQTARLGFDNNTVVVRVEIAAQNWRLSSPPAITDSIKVKGYAFANDTGTLTAYASAPTP